MVSRFVADPSKFISTISQTLYYLDPPLCKTPTQYNKCLFILPLFFYLIFRYIIFSYFKCCFCAVVGKVEVIVWCLFFQTPLMSPIIILFRNNPINIKHNLEKNQISSLKTLWKKSNRLDKFLIKTDKTNFCPSVHPDLVATWLYKF